MMFSQTLVLFFFLISGVISRHLAPTPPNPPTERGCQISRFKSLSPRELDAFKTAKDTYEESMRLKGRKCSSKLFHRNWDLRRLQLSDRLIVLKAELKLTLETLKAMDNPDLEKVLVQPLQTLSHINQEIQSCVTLLPSRGSKPAGQLWLHRLSGQEEGISGLPGGFNHAQPLPTGDPRSPLCR
ncbi:LOW QUALITY PROTEIN: interferon lambda-1-like [Dromiciops gliroides]|uniref:LOW QUALITY PROTEIN: interferon lambda-1-like n=1 Tax=Dromiciops gliroides TaxID=33562 RepID=UPI001CC65E3F|nr:LOW QUALITY PROTEIN: interferon lambda-1-like [Dromiciops gliroides]